MHYIFPLFFFFCSCSCSSSIDGQSGRQVGRPTHKFVAAPAGGWPGNLLRPFVHLSVFQRNERERKKERKEGKDIATRGLLGSWNNTWRAVFCSITTSPGSRQQQQLSIDVTGIVRAVHDLRAVRVRGPLHGRPPPVQWRYYPMKCNWFHRTWAIASSARAK